MGTFSMGRVNEPKNVTERQIRTKMGTLGNSHIFDLTILHLVWYREETNHQLKGTEGYRKTDCRSLPRSLLMYQTGGQWKDLSKGW